MDEQTQQQIVQLVQAAMQGDEQATQQIQQIMQAAQQGNEQAQQLAQMIQAVAQQLQGGGQQQPTGTPSARRGAKLQYINSLRNVCGADEQIEYYKAGGKTCHRCIKAQKARKGDKIKDPVTAFKCGRKIKKNQLGGWFLNPLTMGAYALGKAIGKKFSGNTPSNTSNTQTNKQIVNTDNYRDGEYYDNILLDDTGRHHEYINPHFYFNQDNSGYGRYYPEDTNMELYADPEHGDSTIMITTPKEGTHTYVKGINKGFRSAANAWEHAKQKTKQHRK